MHRVDDRSVPYRLLEPAPPSAAASAQPGQLGEVPLVFWLNGEHVAAWAADGACSEPPEQLVERLLRALADGPSDDARAAGLSSAIPPDAGLQLVTLSHGTAQVDIEPETSLSAERLPVAVGQVVLTVTSAPTVRAVALVSNGAAVQVPLPGGALTDGPVTAEDYRALLPRRTGPEALGCPES